MVQKIYTIENIDCSNCAAKIEAKMNALPEVEEAIIIFPTRQLRLTAENPDALLPKLTEIGRTVEEEFTIRPLTRQETHNHAHVHGKEGWPWDGVIGAALFVLALLLREFSTLAFLLYAAAYLLLGHEILITAGKNLLKGRVFDENFLMSIATLGAFAIGEYPEAVGVMLFYRLGEYFEHRAVERSRSQIMEAVDLRPEVVHRMEADTVTTIPAGEAQVGDLLLVRVGDRIPLDGVVVQGESWVDTAPITGEPVPISVKPGDAVISGYVNTAAQLIIRAEKSLSDSMVTRILESVENAAAGKPKLDRFITRFARIYTPVVVAIAIAVAVIPSVLTGNWNYWVYTALSFLVMSCPCALVLSVPLAFFTGIGVGSRQGILFKSGLTMEALASVKAVALDKTGTLTKGDFSLQEIAGDPEVLTLCAACEQYSTHPIGVSIMAAAAGQKLPKPAQLEEFAGYGIRAVIDGKEVLCGNEKLLERYAVDVPTQEKAGTHVFVARDGQLLGWLRLGDTVKPDAAQGIARMKDMGIVTAMLTGDEDTAARVVGAQVGIDEIYSRLLPEDKLTVLQKLRKAYGPVMFVGDGINDAPVLSGADVGAAMGSGADAAIEAADVVFMKSKVAAVGEAMAIAAQTRRVAWQTVIFALAVKLIVMILGVLGYASMWTAVFADSGVAALCVMYAVAPLYLKNPRKK